MNDVHRFSALVLGLSLLPASAAALPLPLSSQQTLGHPPRTVTIAARAEGSQIVLSAALGRRSDEVSIAAAGVQDVVIERAEVAPGHEIAIVRGTGGASFAALVAVRRGAPRILWSARTDLHGDPGERSAGVLMTEDRTGDGHPNVVVGVRREGAGICGQAETILFPRAYDPRGGQLRPVVLRRLDDAEELEVTATRGSPGPTGPPLVRALLPGGASSRSGLPEDDLSATAPPRALFDRDPASFWAEGRGGPGAQEFVTARWNTRFPIRAFAVVLSPSGDVAAQLGRPRTFWLLGESGARLRVTVPDDPIAEPGARYWIVPPEPLPWRCVTLVLDEAYAPDGAAAAAVHTGLAELEAYTDLDWGEGVQGLVRVLVEGGSDGDEAARLLESLGAPAVSALDAAWERLGEQGRRRAVRVFSSAGRGGVTQGVSALERAAADPAEPVRLAAVRALGSLGPEAGAVLGRLVARPGLRGDEAVRPLMRHEPDTAVPALLAALSADGGTERPALREGLALSVRRAGDDAGALYRAWLSEQPPLSAQIAAALGLASLTQTRPLIHTQLTALAGHAERFEDRWRVVQAARLLPADPPMDRWLAAVATDAEEWMLRAAAVEALRDRRAANRQYVAQRALTDDYPRVRIEAIAVFDALDSADAALASLARRDPWPMVRAAAVGALFDRRRGRAAVLRSIRDRSPRVRRAALQAATSGGAREALPLVVARLQDGEEWPQVTGAALRYVSELCLSEGGEAVLAVVRRGVREDAWAPDLDVAVVAADLAMRLGGETRVDMLRIAGRANTPENIRQVVQRRQSEPHPCGGASAP